MKRPRHVENSLACSVTLIILLLAGCAAENPTPPELALTLEGSALETSAAKQGGFAILESPATPGRPIYVGIIPVPDLSTDDGETIVPILRERSCIPPDANLLLPFDIEAVDCSPPLHTNEWWVPENLAMGGRSGSTLRSDEATSTMPSS